MQPRHELRSVAGSGITIEEEGAIRRYARTLELQIELCQMLDDLDKDACRRAITECQVRMSLVETQVLGVDRSGAVQGVRTWEVS